MDTDAHDRDYHMNYDDSTYDPPFVTLNCSNDEPSHLKVFEALRKCNLFLLHFLILVRQTFITIYQQISWSYEKDYCTTMQMSSCI